MGFFLKEPKSGAIESDDKVYRHLLWREWDGVARAPQKHWMKNEAGELYSIPKSVLWILLNPSKANATINDPTTRRLIEFTKSFGYDRMELINLFSYRATDPQDLRQPGLDLFGPEYDKHVDAALGRSSLIVCAWGSHGTLQNAHTKMVTKLLHKHCFTLGRTANLQPAHPLYLAADTQLVLTNPEEFNHGSLGTEQKPFRRQISRRTS